MNESLKKAMGRAADAVGSAEPDLAAIERRGRQRRRRRIGVTGFVAVLVALAVAVPLYGLSGMGASRQPVSGTTPSSNGEIWVRVGGGDGPSFVYKVDPTTGTASPLFNDQEQGSDGLPGEENPDAVGQQYDWSPDGSRVVFSGWSEDTPSRPVLYIMNADGSQRTRVEGSDSRSWGVGAFNAYPSWSPDGSQIAYARRENSDVIVNGIGRYIAGCESSPSLCPSQIHVIDAAGGNDRQLTHEPVSASMPDWSPDGRSIVFVSAESDNTSRIGVIDAAGGEPTFLTDGRSEDLFPHWSPDGSTIAFISDRGGRFELSTMAADGGPAKQISDVLATSPPSFAWSPDGTEIALSGEEALLILTADGSIVSRVTPAVGYGVGDIAWRPAAPAGDGSPPSQSPGTSATEQVIGFHGLLLTVPSSWKINDTWCGTPQSDTVVRDQGATASCLVPRPPGISSVEVVDDPRYWLSQIDSSLKTFTNQNGVRLESGALTGRRGIALYSPQAGALIVLEVTSGAESNAIIDSIQLADTDPNGCAMREMQLDPPASYEPSASLQDVVIPGSPTSIAICHYVGGWLASSASETGSEMADLVGVVNALPEGFVHPPAGTYDPTQCDEPPSPGGETGNGFILWVHGPDDFPYPLWAHVGFCGHLGITNGARDGQLTPKLAEVLNKPLHAGYGMPGRLIPDAPA